MTPEEQMISDEAFRYVKDNSEEIIKKFAGQSVPVATPVSLFMAGSPGAGKTEVSKGLMRQFETVPVRIDADEIRPLCPEYTGANAHLFQRAATKGVHILYDYALHKKPHLILDGTFAYSDSVKNIQRSLDYGRKAELWFVYQDPRMAWEFTKARETLQARHVSKDVFIKTFLMAKENTKQAKMHFGTLLTLNLLIKNTDNTDGRMQLNIPHDQLDPYMGQDYTEEELNRILV